LWAALAACADVEGGARGVFRHNRDRVVRLAVADIGVARDVDRPEDLA
jgi:CTP:molybdopterin cytidylyltransferase MocA